MTQTEKELVTERVNEYRNLEQKTMDYVLGREKTIDEINKDLQDMRAEELGEIREDDDASE